MDEYQLGSELEDAKETIAALEAERDNLKALLQMDEIKETPNFGAAQKWADELDRRTKAAEAELAEMRAVVEAAEKALERLHPLIARHQVLQDLQAALDAHQQRKGDR